jgi:hypothetical protein
MSNKEIKFPYYSGNIRFTKAIGHVTLEQFINSHKKPLPQIIKVLDKVAAASKAGDTKLKRLLKHQLFSFTPSVIIPLMQKRKYDNIESFTGLMQLDFDGLDGKQDAKDLRNILIRDHNQIVCSYLSPSMLGVKALLKITKCEDVRQYKAIHKAMVNEFGIYDCLDESTKNAMLPLFLSSDESIMYRDYDECDTFSEEDWSEPTYVNLVDEPANHPPTSNDYHYLKTIELFKSKIGIIVDNGHPQMRNACLVLGSRSGAGYIDKQEAISLATVEIHNNMYFHKDTLGYLKTATWAIEQGISNPKYY